MDLVIAQKLQAMTDEAANVDEAYQFDRWSARVHQFLITAVGTDEAKHFQELVAAYWADTVALRRGYLEGLL